MRIAIIINGVVDNVIEADPSFSPEDGAEAVPSETAGPGWSYDGANFFPLVATDSVPDEIDMWRLKAVLAARGLSDAADILAKKSGLAVSSFWQYATSVHRTSPMLAPFASELGLAESDVDDIFRAAAQLTF